MSSYNSATFAMFSLTKGRPRIRGNRIAFVKSRPLISTFPASTNCRRQIFLSTMPSNPARRR